MRYHEYAAQDKIIFPAKNHYPESELTTAYAVYPRQLIHAQRINSVAAKIAEICLYNLDNPTPLDIRRGIEKFLEVQKIADKAFAKHLRNHKKIAKE